MPRNSYTSIVEVVQAPEVVFNCINEVSKWWSKDFEGSSAKLNDEFIIHHPGRHYSKQKLVEVIPCKKIVWLVTDSKLNWLERDQHEWTNTKMIFEITMYSNRLKLISYCGLVANGFHNNFANGNLFITGCTNSNVMPWV